MFKTFWKSPLLILSIVVFAIAGCSDQSQNSAEQAVNETADQVEQAVTDEVEETVTDEVEGTTTQD